MSVNLFDLTGKIALITGATHGLGKAMAIGLGNAGATIIINGASSQEKLDIAVSEYKALGLKAFGYLFDVTDETQVIRNIAKIEREVGVIDVLVNNAGIIKRIPLEEMEVSDFEKVIKVDLVGAYAAAKGGLKMLTRNMATEWAKHNIQINGIGPGYFATSQTAPIRVDGHPFNEFIISRTPAGRWGDPEDLQGAVIFLSSKASDFVNGQIIYVDGGILATIGKPSSGNL